MADSVPHHVLGGIRVVDVTTDIAGPYCAKLLADLGADVLKIEPPEGDPLRQWGPFRKGENRGGLFWYLNRHKARRSLDLRADPAALVGELENADVLVEDLGPAGLERAGIDPRELRATHPGLVIVRLSPFGQEGPLCDVPATPLVQQAASGWVSFRGIDSPVPVQVGGRAPEYVGGAYAALGALTMLWSRERSGEGGVVDVSLHEALVGTLSYPMLMHEAMLERGMQSPRGIGALLGVVRCKDGWIGINSLTGQHWLDICAMLEIPEFGEQQISVMFGGPERAQFYAAAQPWLDARTADEILELAQAMRIPAAPVGNGETMPELPQYAGRGFFQRDQAGAVFPASPLRLSSSAPVPAPPPRTAASEPSPAGSPFAGLRVVDLSTFWSGAYVGCYLGAFGADVIKVESVQKPDGFRFVGAFPFDGDDWFEHGPLFQGANLNKRAITLDLGSVEGREALRQLISSADVLIENFSPRVLEQFQLTEKELLALKPELIVMRMPGFGLEGPWRNFVGWAYGFEQTGGMSWVTGHADGPPINPGGVADPIVGVHAAIALLGALEHRARTGVGQLVEVAQIEVAAAISAEQVLAFSMSGELQTRWGNRQRDMIQGVYPARADGDVEDWVAISVRGDGDWDALTDLLGSPAALGAEDFSSHEGRWRQHDEIDEHIAGWTRSLPPGDIISRLRERGVPAAVVLVPAAMYADPQLLARDYYCEFVHPVSGARRYPGWPMRYEPGPAQHHRSGAPTLGQHNDEVLGEDLGFTEAQLADLRARNVIGSWPLGL